MSPAQSTCRCDERRRFVMAGDVTLRDQSSDVMLTDVQYVYMMSFRVQCVSCDVLWRAAAGVRR